MSTLPDPDQIPIFSKWFFIQSWFTIWMSRVASWLKSTVEGVSAIRARLQNANFGKIFTWTFILGVVGAVSDFLKIGITQTIDIFNGVINDPYLLRGGGILQWASQSLNPVWEHGANLIPEFFRWLGWWLGGDWLVWSFLCSLIFAFCGWVLSVFIKAIASLIRFILGFV